MAEATETVGPWAALTGSVVSTGFAVVVAWHLLTKALPKMNNDFLTSLAEMQKQTQASMKEMEQGGRTALRELQAGFEARDRERRSDSKDALAAVVQHCEREATRRDELLKVELALVTRASEDERLVLEDVRDVLRDIVTTRRRPRLPPTPPAPGPGQGGA